MDRLRGEFDRIELADMSFAEQYQLLNGSVIPRPIAFVSTLNEDGTVNAAPFSSFMIASVEAGYLAFSVGPSDKPKHTLQNIERNREFVINTVPEALAQQVQFCGEAQAGRAKNRDGRAKHDSVREDRHAAGCGKQGSVRMQATYNPVVWREPDGNRRDCTDARAQRPGARRKN